MQLVKYKWNVERGVSGEPFLFARGGGETRKIRLFGESIRMKLGDKTCIGYFRNGRHHECPKKRLVESERVCRECALNDDFFMCMKCDGSICINEPQRNDCAKSRYYIYLAAFNTMLKVGISQEFRILERLIEQGADMGAKIGAVTDGKLVREVEQKIKKELGVTDRMTGDDKHRMLFGNVNAAAVNIFSAYSKLRVNGLSSFLISPEIYNLQGIYRLDSVQGFPRSVAVESGLELDGNVLAAKGNIVVMETDDGIISVNASKLIGCEVFMD